MTFFYTVQVTICMPPLKALRTVTDRMKNLGSYLVSSSLCCLYPVATWQVYLTKPLWNALWFNHHQHYETLDNKTIISVHYHIHNKTSNDFIKGILYQCFDFKKSELHGPTILHAISISVFDKV